MKDKDLIRMIHSDLYHYFCTKGSIFIFFVATILFACISWHTESNGINELSSTYLYNMSSDSILLSFLLLLVLFGLISNGINSTKMIVYQKYIHRKIKVLTSYIVSNIAVSFVFLLPEITIYLSLLIKNDLNASEKSLNIFLLGLIKGIIVLFNYFRLSIVFSSLAFINNNEIKGFIYSVLYLVIQFIASFGLTLIRGINRQLLLFILYSGIHNNLSVVMEYGVFYEPDFGIKFPLFATLFGMLIDFSMLLIYLNVKKMKGTVKSENLT